MRDEITSPSDLHPDAFVVNNIKENKSCSSERLKVQLRTTKPDPLGTLGRSAPKVAQTVFGDTSGVLLVETRQNRLSPSGNKTNVNHLVQC